MYKVLLADDERLIRITLKNMLDWHAFDCEVVGAAKDGKEALQLFEELEPEIVITDLKMPGMDGIELITRIKKLRPDTQVIALSNYSDFEYVRDAMKAGAFDYLLKVTLEKKELERIIQQVKENCEECSSSEQQEVNQAIRELQQCLILMKNEHVTSAEEFHNVLSQPVFQPYREGYQLAYFRVDNIHYLYETKLRDHAALKKHLQDLLQESIPMRMDYTLIFISNHSGVLLFQSKEKLRVRNICHSIIRNIAQYLDVNLSITLSDLLLDTEAFADTFAQLLDAHDVRFYEGDGSLIQSEQQRSFHELNMNELTYHTDILEAVQTKDFITAAKVLRQAMATMRSLFIYPHQVKDYFVFIFNNIEGNEIIKGTRQAFPVHAIAKTMRQCETADYLEDVMEAALARIEHWMKDSTTAKYRQEVLDVMDYVDTHMSQKVTLKELSDSVGMNESSLSRLFKSETGVNLNYYINEKKMKHAMELLSKNRMIKDIAAAVGIEDPLYFNKVFKKYYGISPTEMKKKQSQERQE